MAKINRLCPFTHRSCKDCSFYRGRHCYTDFLRRYHASDYAHKNIDFNKVSLLSLNRNGNKVKLTEKSSDELPDIQLKIIDLITDQSRVENLKQASSWKWDNPDIQRLINGTIHITSWEQLLNYSRNKVKSGDKEIIIYETPAYLLISGG